MSFIRKFIENTNLKQFFLENLLILFFGYDFIIKIIVHYTQISLFYNYVIVFKVLIVLAVITSIGFNSINKTYVLPLLGLILAYIITQLFHYNNLSIDDIQFNGYYFLSSVTPILFLLFFNNYSSDITKSQVNKVIWFLVISSVFLLIGYLFQIEVFRSYFRGGRFGYSGFLLYHHEAGFIYFIIINLLYFKLKKNKTNKNIFLFLIVLFLSLLVGTKKTLLFNFIFFCYLFADNIKNRKAVLLTLVSAALGLLLFSKSLLKFYYLFKEIYEKDGFWSSFLSFRNILFNDRFYPYVTENNSIINIIFGWPFFNNHRTEMEVFDAFLFFGFIGIICYTMLFIKILKGKNKLSYFLVLTLVIGAVFSGNLLASVNVMILLFITLKYINLQETTTY
ncbi:hypothetical protein [Olleya sp. YS]|uniref:hypothetical protein n=1 Tax=Olleya sp. YS TaxID=3028318 RepID=UPI0024342E86|nr:hypothetical protein [Olleya sp. YS]WGD35772.1 hypothetical protein Ollyesu_05000 [Olleya sp. YS]